MNPEGGESIHVLDTNKLTCPNCNGVEIMLSDLMDDGNDITDDERFADLKITIGGGSIQGFVGLCAQCGHEWVPIWYLFDVSATTTVSLVMTNLDASVANGLAGAFAIALCGTDIRKYVIIASNTLNPPTTITVAFAFNSDCDGLFMITNVEPIGLTRIVA